MATARTPELSPAERRLCIQSTLRAPQDRSVAMARWSMRGSHYNYTLEERYLPDFQSDDPIRRDFFIPSVDAKVQGEISDVLLSDLDLRKQSEKYQAKEDRVVDGLAERARQTGLTMPLDKKELTGLLVYEDGVEEYLDRTQGRLLRFKGWEVEATTSGSPILIQGQQIDGQFRFLVTDLDKLHEADPLSLQEDLRNYSAARQMWDAIGHAGFNLEHHTFEPTEARAEYLNTLADTVPIGRIIGESEKAAKTFAFLRAIGWNYTQAVDRFANGHVKGDTRNGYLDHMAICTANPEDQRQMSAALLQTHDLFQQATGFSREEAHLRGSEFMPPADLKVLRSPIRHYEMFARDREKDLSVRVEQASSLVDLMDRAKSAGLENFEGLLATEYPEHAKMLQRFKQWFKSEEVFESFVKNSARSFGYSTIRRDKPLLDNLDKAIDRELRMNDPGRKKGDYGVRSSRHPDDDISEEGDIYFTEPTLKELVRLAVISKVVKNDDTERADAVFGELRTRHSSEAEELKGMHESARQQKYRARAYMLEHGFGPTEISRMAELATTTKYREPQVDGLVYNAMFSVLWLLKGGSTHVGSSQVLRLALERAFPNSDNPEAWKQFQEEIGAKYIYPSQ